jgi:hypothetical protein
MSSTHVLLPQNFNEVYFLWGDEGPFLRLLRLKKPSEDLATRG